MATATDYDAPRRNQTDESDDSLEALKARRSDTLSGTIDVDETDSLDLPGADLSGLSEEEMTIRVLPKQSDEFTCSSCFLVHHRSRLAREAHGRPVCRDCA